MSLEVRPRPTSNLTFHIWASLAAEIANREMDRWGLHRSVAIRYGAITAFWELIGFPTIPIISGYRSCDEQRDLLDRGRPAARRSWHTNEQDGLPASRAIDLQGSAVDGYLFRGNPLLDLFGNQWEEFGGRWGGRFRAPSPNHLDVPGTPDGRKTCW